jgi:diaminohydroxyphosphoribosylaminopyrimidine deaminase/5-amino-6-(5-phosphoribosylamino)uracil reductase
VTKVVAACRDPFPPVSAGGLAELQAAGITIEASLLRREAQELNAPYFKLRATGRPFVTAKWAMTLDGKVASHTGDSRWVSSPQARERVQRLRAVSDAVLVGIGTVLADDPLLTCRVSSARTLTRVVLDGGSRLPLRSRLVETAAESPVLVAATAAAPAERVAALRARGAEVLLLSAAGDRVSPEALLDELGRRGMTNLLVEGGPTVFAEFFARRLVDRVVVYLAPKLVGGERAPGALGGEGAAKMADALALELRGWERVGQDLELQATVPGVFGAYFPAE